MQGKNFSRRHFEIFFFLFFSLRMISRFVHGDNLYEMSNPIFWEKIRNINLSSAEIVHSVLGVDA